MFHLLIKLWLAFLQQSLVFIVEKEGYFVPLFFPSFSQIKVDKKAFYQQVKLVNQ